MKMLSNGMFVKPGFSGGLQQDGIAVFSGLTLISIASLFEVVVLFVQLNSIKVNTANRKNSLMIFLFFN
jgi:hypothetical protein